MDDSKEVKQPKPFPIVDFGYKHGSEIEGLAAGVGPRQQAISHMLRALGIVPDYRRNVAEFAGWVMAERVWWLKKETNEMNDRKYYVVDHTLDGQHTDEDVEWAEVMRSMAEQDCIQRVVTVLEELRDRIKRSLTMLYLHQGERYVTLEEGQKIRDGFDALWEQQRDEKPRRHRSREDDEDDEDEDEKPKRRPEKPKPKQKPKQQRTPEQAKRLARMRSQ